MLSKIRIAILDDHQSIIDGFRYRLSMDPDIQIVGTALFGDEIEFIVANNPVDVLLLDVGVPNSSEDDNPYPVLHVIPRLLKAHPSLSILIISMYDQRSLIEALVDTGISGYIFKDDQASIQQLDKIVRIVGNGGIYFSQGAYQDARGEPPGSVLTNRQLEALSLCDSNPDGETIVLAKSMGITGSTLRNLLSGTYLRLGVRTRAAAIAKAHQLGILPDKPVPAAASGVGKPKAPARRRPRTRQPAE